jgi:RNA polymerase primary sigma factor
MSPADVIKSTGLAEQMRRALAAMTPREEKALRKRYGIGDASERSLEEAGQDFTATRERIRQIDRKRSRKRRIG